MLAAACEPELDRRGLRSSELHTWSHYGGWTHRAQSGTRPWAGHMGDTVASQEM